MNGTAPTIELAGVRLRALRPDDAVAWHSYLSDPLVIELTSYPVMSPSAVQSMLERCLDGYATGHSCTWALAKQANDELVGTCGFNELSRGQGRAEMAYDLARSCWGRGLMAQAVAACLGWVFEQPEFDRVEAFVMAGNTRSERVLERARFTRERHLPAYRNSRGQPRDYWMFGILRPQWEQALGDALGLESGVVRLVDYDARWPALFAAEQRRIRQHCAGALAPRLEHVGGTSIPGMCTKPVLDIAAGRPRDAAPGDVIAALERAGYEHRGERGVPGREFFSRGQPRAYHLHLVADGGPLWRDYLAFRDYLRAHPETARAFADRKRALAARFPRDREAYMNAKSAHVQEVLRIASRLY